jgi:hypothetical protein
LNKLWLLVFVFLIALPSVVAISEWEVGVYYVIGDRISYLGVNYEVIQSHTSASHWTPDIVPSLYKVLENACDEGVWCSGLSVSVGEVYLYEGAYYRVIQSHTTQGDWTPDIVPALFEKMLSYEDGKPVVVMNGVEIRYKEEFTLWGDEVVNNVEASKRNGLVNIKVDSENAGVLNKSVDVFVDNISFGFFPKLYRVTYENVSFEVPIYESVWNESNSSFVDVMVGHENTSEIRRVRTEVSQEIVYDGESKTVSFGLDGFSEYDLTDGLIAYYKLDSTSGSTAINEEGTDGSLNGGSFVSDGKINYGFSASSNGDYIIAGENHANRDTFSISMWVKPSSWPTSGISSQQVFYGDRQASPNNEVRLFKLNNAGGNKFGFFGYWGGSYKFDLTIDSLDVDEWSHIVAYYSPTTAGFYVNGVLANSSSFSSNSRPSATLPTRIGHWFGTLQDYQVRGVIDEVGIWNVVLSGDDVSLLYNSGNGLSYDNFINENSLPVNITSFGYNDLPYFVGDAIISEVVYNSTLSNSISSNLTVIRERSGSNSTLWTNTDFAVSSDGTNKSVIRNDTAIPSSAVVKGDKFYTVVNAVNSSNLSQALSASSTIVTTVLNTAPTVSGAVWSNSNPLFNEDFSGSCTPSDADEETLRIEYYVNRTRSASTTTVASGNVTGLTHPYSATTLFTINSADTNISDEYVFSCQAFDSENSSTIITSSTATVVDYPLNMTELLFYNGNTTTANIELAGRWNSTYSGVIGNYTIIRERAGSNTTIISDTTELSDLDGTWIFEIPAVNSADTIKGDIYYAFANAVNSTNTSMTLSNTLTANVTIINTAPTISTAAWSPTIAVVNETLSGLCTPADVDADTLRIEYFVNRTRSNTTTTVASGNVTNVTSPYSATTLFNITGSDILLSDVYAFTCQAFDDEDASSSLLTSSNNTAVDVDAIYIEFRDEESNDFILQNISVDLIANTTSYSFTTNTSFINFNILPERYFIRYNSLGYDEGFYIVTLEEGEFESLTLYMINSTASDLLTVTIIDEAAKNVEGAVVKLLKYDLDTNTYKVIDIRQTDVAGEVLYNVRKNEEFYKFVVELDGVAVRTTNPAYITADNLNIQITRSLIVGSEFFSLYGITSSVTYNNETGNFRAEYNDASNIGSNYCLSVHKVGRSRTLINETCSTSPVATLLLPVAVENGSIYEANLYLKINPTQNLNQFVLDLSEVFAAGSLGLLIQIFITLFFAFTFMYSPATGLIMTPLSLIIGRILQLNSLDWVVIVPLLLIGMLVAYLLESQK